MQAPTIEGELTCFAAVEQKPSLLKFLKKGKQLRLKLNGVT
jgi:hypothetical protein